jgi:PadR family transcriptional regulator PadR
MGIGRIRGQLLKGTTPLLVLSVLRDGELYGYEIAQRIRERSGGAFAPSEGALYPALHALEANGALVATWRESDKGPRRRYYAIIPPGRSAVRGTGKGMELVRERNGALGRWEREWLGSSASPWLPQL